MNNKIMDIVCDCGKEMRVKWWSWKGDRNRKYCGDECRQRGYRKTSKGKEVVARYNRRYKRVDLEWKCYNCNEMFLYPRKRTLCNVCLEYGVQHGYKNFSAAVGMRKRKDAYENPTKSAETGNWLRS